MLDVVPFLVLRHTTEDTKEEILDDLTVRLLLLDHLGDHTALLNAVVHGVAIHEVEGLGKGGLHLHLAGADRLTLCTTEGGEEVVRHGAVGDLHGAGAERQPLKLVRRLCDLGDGVEQHFGAHAAHLSVGEVQFVAGIRFIDLRTALVGLGGADVADELAHVVFVLGQLLGQFADEFGIGRRIRNAHIVHRLDDANAVEMRPDDVRDVASEERIARRGHPVGQHFAAVFPRFDLGSIPAEELRLHHGLSEEVLRFATFAVVDDDFRRVVGGLAADLAEEGLEAVVVIHRPAVEGMVVTLRALDAHTHEDLGDVFSELELVQLGLVEIHRRIADGTSGGGEQLDDDFVERDVFANALGEPVVVEQSVLVEGRLVVVDGGADLQQLGPLHHPEFSEFLALQQLVHKGGALVGILVAHEFAHVGGLREDAGDVDKGATDEFVVGANLRRQDAQLVEVFVNEFVDVVGLGEFGPLVIELVRNDEHLGGHGIDVKAGEHEGRATVSGGHETIFIDAGGGIVVRHEQRKVRHIAIGAVGVGGAHGDLLRHVLALHDDLVRIDLDAGDGGHILRVVLGAIGDPFDEVFVVNRVRLKALVTRVRHGTDGLFDQ